MPSLVNLENRLLISNFQPVHLPECAAKAKGPVSSDERTEATINVTQASVLSNDVSQSCYQGMGNSVTPLLLKPLERYLPEAKSRSNLW
jgi:hypothetical protein